MKTTLEQYAEFQEEQKKKQIQITALALKERFEDAHIVHDLSKDTDGAYTTCITHDLWLSFLSGFFLAEEMFYLVKKP
jgi:hypothetical protein